MHWRNLRRNLCSVFLTAMAVPVPVAGANDGVSTLATEQSFEEAAQSLEDAIVNRGYNVDYHGHIGDMFDRTAEDVGASRQLFQGAELFTFCSAVVSRRVIEHDVANIAYCPYVLFVYQEPADDNPVTLGFRRLPPGGGRDEVNTLLESILESAADGF